MTNLNDLLSENNLPLCVDLDGTLVRSDTLFEGILVLLKKAPWYIFVLPFVLLRGKAFLKSYLAKRANIDFSLLPYNTELIEFLKTQQGRDIVLCTASNKLIAEGVAKEVGIFNEIISSGDVNIRGEKKAEILENKYGVKKFDYIGDAPCDWSVFRSANKQYLVSSSSHLIKKAKRDFSNIEFFPLKIDKKKEIFCMLRCHQWVKNLLLFVPVLAAHQLLHLPVILNVFYAFLIFCLCCSGVYIVNDLLDLENDRKHFKKRLRPFASGALPLKWGFVLGPSLLLLSFVLSLFLPFNFSITLLAYLMITSVYSWYVKQKAIMDIIVLACLYTIRIIAGGSASDIFVSPWLLAFSLFMFLSLACVKRVSELKLNTDRISLVAGRGYTPEDMPIISQFGTSSGFISVLVLALYINANALEHLYARPWMIWLCCPFILYWIARIWLFTQRGLMEQDPVLFAVKDKISYFILYICIMILFFAGWTGGVVAG